jgi:excisionase family DNA binding protein
MAAAKTKPSKKPTKRAAVKNGVPEPADVLTLAEAAAYLRATEEEVLYALRTQGLPGREIGGQWRFLKTCLQKWLEGPPKRYNKEAFLALAGAWKDDPYVDEMLKDIYKQRGRPMTEDGE